MTEYRTSDLYLSAFLKAKGCCIKDISINNGQVFFQFAVENLNRMLRGYFNNANVNVLTYVGALRDLRTIIKSGDRFTVKS